MKTYYVGGTVGDAYVILCKLYSIAIAEPILCRHYTKHAAAKSAIEEIYGLIPNIKVEFLDTVFSGVRLCGAFNNLAAEKASYGIEPEYYPEFELESIEHLELPETYEVLQTVAGIRQNRMLPMGHVENILVNARTPVVFVGEVDGRRHGHKDLCGRTSIKQVINIIKSSNHFYGPQGFLSYVAVSQKVQSTVFIETESDEVAIRARTEATEQWERYLTKR